MSLSEDSVKTLERLLKNYWRARNSALANDEWRGRPHVIKAKHADIEQKFHQECRENDITADDRLYWAIVQRQLALELRGPITIIRRNRVPSREQQRAERKLEIQQGLYMSQYKRREAKARGEGVD